MKTWKITWQFIFQIVKRSSDPIIQNQLNDGAVAKAGLPDPPDAETIQRIIEIIQAIGSQVFNTVHKNSIKKYLLW